jgi:hypothetical protein
MMASIQIAIQKARIDRYKNIRGLHARSGAQFIISSEVRQMFPFLPLPESLTNNSSFLEEDSVEGALTLQFFEGTLELAFTPRNLSSVTRVKHQPENKWKPWSIDFVNGAMANRVRKSDNNSEMLVRAFGGKVHADGPSKWNTLLPTIIDLTAGMGKDSFILASVGGFRVIAIERNPVLAAMLGDAIRRLRTSEPYSGAGHRMTVLCMDSTDARVPAYISEILAFSSVAPLYEASSTAETANKCVQLPSDVSSKVASKVHTPAVQSEIGVYIDPMYPRASIGKRSAVRKDSQVLRMLSAPFESIDSGMHPGHYGDKADAALLATARCLLDLSVGQRNRRSCAVVKRPNRAATLGGELAKWRPSGRIEGSTHRYELYRL